jgi:hypothetical protein
VFYLTDAGVLAAGVAAFSLVFCTAFSVVFLTSLDGSAATFAVAGGAATGVAGVVAANAPKEIKPATRVAISLLISWTFQLFVKSSS